MNQCKVMFCLVALGGLIFAHKVICIFSVLWYLLRNRLKDVLNMSKNIGCAWQSTELIIGRLGLPTIVINLWHYIKLRRSGVSYVQFLCNFLSDVVLVLLYCIIDQSVVFLCWIIFKSFLTVSFSWLLHSTT